MAVTDQTANDDHMDINLRTLKRNDPAVKEILGSASQVAAYEYSETTWKRLDIEGSLFLVSRHTVPSYSIIINNRLSTENLIEPITPDCEFRLDMKTGSAFLMVHNNALHKISCIWFYEGDELLAVHKKIESILASIKVANASTKRKVQSQVASNKPVTVVSKATPKTERIENVLAKLGIMTGNGPNNERSTNHSNDSLNPTSQSTAPAPSCISTSGLAGSAPVLPLQSQNSLPAAENVLQSLFASSIINSAQKGLKF